MALVIKCDRCTGRLKAIGCTIILPKGGDSDRRATIVVLCPDCLDGQKGLRRWLANEPEPKRRGTPPGKRGSNEMSIGGHRHTRLSAFAWRHNKSIGATSQHVYVTKKLKVVRRNGAVWVKADTPWPAGKGKS